MKTLLAILIAGSTAALAVKAYALAVADSPVVESGVVSNSAAKGDRLDTIPSPKGDLLPVEGLGAFQATTISFVTGPDSSIAMRVPLLYVSAN